MTVRVSRQVVCTVAAFAFASIAVSVTASAADEPYESTIPIVNGKEFKAKEIACIRHPLGIPNDYKPWLAQLKNGDLMIVCFCFGPYPNVEGYVERAVFWGSKDGGKTWSERQERQDIHGREFSLNVLHDGTILMTCHFLSNDVFNKSKYTYSKVFRSEDNGKTWSELRIGPDGFPPKGKTMADWTVFELPDEKTKCKRVVHLGVGIHSAGEAGPKYARIWRSWDSGRTWNRTLHPDTDNWVDVDGFFAQCTTFVTRTGAILHPVRVDRGGPHWHIPGTPEKLKTERGDNGDRMMLWESNDRGRTWRKREKGGRFGTYGEMYPRFLQLKDGRILLTFTVRSNSTDGYPLGLRAILSDDDGHTWDFSRDRFILSKVNHAHSGGGFGNTVQLEDGSLVSVYSYRGEDLKTHIEALRWQLPDH